MLYTSRLQFLKELVKLNNTQHFQLFARSVQGDISTALQNVWVAKAVKEVCGTYPKETWHSPTELEEKYDGDDDDGGR